MIFRATRIGLLLLGPALLFCQLAAAAGPLRLEAVGVVPTSSQKPTPAPREAAIQEALKDGVHRVAQDLLREALVPEEERRQSLQTILGKDMLPYTTRFRILEDLGERPALFFGEPGFDSEYVVVVEVHVDVDRVRARLARAGWVEAKREFNGAQAVVLEVDGLSEYAAYARLRELLVSDVGASSATPLELTSDRVVFAVKAEGASLLSELLAVAPPELQIVPMGGEGNRLLRVAAIWDPSRIGEGQEPEYEEEWLEGASEDLERRVGGGREALEPEPVGSETPGDIPTAREW